MTLLHFVFYSHCIQTATFGMLFLPGIGLEITLLLRKRALCTMHTHVHLCWCYEVHVLHYSRPIPAQDTLDLKSVPLAGCGFFTAYCQLRVSMAQLTLGLRPFQIVSLDKAAVLSRHDYLHLPPWSISLGNAEYEIRV
jgi:hypothetical protein